MKDLKSSDTPFLTISRNIDLFHTPNQNLYLLTFFSFEKVSSLSLKQVNFCGTNFNLSSKTTKPLCFFKFIQFGYETFQIVKQALENHIAKTLTWS